MFKKKKIWQDNKINLKTINTKNIIKKSFISIFIWLLLVILIWLVWLWFLNQVSKVKLDIDTIMSLMWFEFSFEDIKKSNIKISDEWKTNILITWRWWDENDAPLLTDSIIIASIYYEKNTISFFSIPRDLYVEYPTWYKWRINEAYMRWLKRNPDEKEAIKNLTSILTKMTWEEIHYYVDLDFAWFRNIIDMLWWIDINVPKEILDTTYPWPNYTYQTFHILSWPQNLDWATALKYARSRHWTSDFDRSIRQQLVIKAIKEKVVSMWVISNPTKIKWIYSTVKKYIKTDLDISQIIKLWLFVKDIPNTNIISSNLNDTCFYWSNNCEKWWFLYVPPRDQFGWASVLLQDWGTASNTSNYDDLALYTNIIFNYPLIYKENLKINVFNATKKSWIALNFANNLKKYWFNIPDKNSLWSIKEEKFEKSKIFYKTWSWGTKPETVDALELFIFWWSIWVDVLPKYWINDDVDIEIVLWDDYKFINY